MKDPNCVICNTKWEKVGSGSTKDPNCVICNTKWEKDKRYSTKDPVINVGRDSTKEPTKGPVVVDTATVEEETKDGMPLLQKRASEDSSSDEDDDTPDEPKSPPVDVAPTSPSRRKERRQRGNSEKNPTQHRPKPKKKKKKKESRNNNKKIKLSPDTKPASFTKHLLPPKIDPRVETIPAALAVEVKAYFAKAHNKANTTEANDDVAGNGEPIDDEVHDNDAGNGEQNDEEVGKPVNDESYSPFDQPIGLTGETRIYDGVLFAQYSNCHHELFYQSCEIYGDDPNDSEEAIERLANSGEVSWSEPSTPSLGDDSMFYEDFLYDQFVVERTHVLLTKESWTIVKMLVSLKLSFIKRKHH